MDKIDPYAFAGPDGRIEVVPLRLSLRERFRLIEIAHETGDYQIRDAAIILLKENQELS